MTATGKWVGRALLRLGFVSAIAFFLVIGVGPMTGKYRIVTVLTDSMQPKMPAGSMAIVVPIDPASIRAGDVITFEAPVDGSPVVTHRVIEVLEDGASPVIRTKGDANTAPDDWTARISGSVAWRRVAVVPFAGRAINVLRSPVVQNVTVYGIPLLLLVLVLRTIWTQRPDDRAVAQAGT